MTVTFGIDVVEHKPGKDRGLLLVNGEQGVQVIGHQEGSFLSFEGKGLVVGQEPRCQGILCLKAVEQVAKML